MPPLTNLVTYLGPGPLRQAAIDWCARLENTPVEDHPALPAFLRYLAARDLRLLDTIVSHPQLALQERGWIESILSEAHALAAPGNRKYVERLAARVGLRESLAPTRARQEVMTPSQARVFEHLRALAALYFEGHAQQHPGLNLRLNPLVVAPSGAGKTFLVHRLAEALKVPVLRITVGDWIVLGARQQPPTIELIQTQLDRHERMIIFLDELDKFRSLDSPWSLAQIAEILSLLDRRVGYAGTEKQPWLPRHDAKLRDHVFMVGGGTWQELWSERLNRTMGFGTAGHASDAICERIRQAQLIPPELLNRFLDEWLVIEPYTSADFVAIGRHLGLGREVLDPDAAAASGRNFRFVESAVTAAALKAQLRRQASDRPSAAPRDLSAA